MFDLFTKLTVNELSVFEHMKQVGDKVGVFAQYMKGATFMIPTPRLLDQVVQMIDKIKMEDRDTKGDVYEYLLSKIATAGTNGLSVKLTWGFQDGKIYGRVFSNEIELLYEKFYKGKHTHVHLAQIHLDFSH